MGCCSSDALPDIPATIKPDPDVNVTITVVVRRIGRMWGRDYSVHEGTVYPQDATKRKDTMWLWFNKSTGQGTNAVIDLENFVRGNNPQDKDKGMVLYTAVINDRPVFEQFQRIAHSSRESFWGFFRPETYNNPDDAYYLNHPKHTAKRDRGRSRRLTPEMITKWRLHTRAVLKDGNLGRGADLFQKEEVYLEVFSSGTVATTWEETDRVVEDRDQDGRVTGTHIERDIEKDETEFVDRIEFRLIFKGELWSEWTAPGDTDYNGSGDVAISSPFYTTSIKGGWFSPDEYITTTLPNVDPAFALILSHLCNSEYSIPKIKEHLKPNTPSRPPSTWNWGPQGGMRLDYGGSIAVSGSFSPMWR